jgi:hypothetical protein
VHPVLKALSRKKPETERKMSDDSAKLEAFFNMREKLKIKPAGNEEPSSGRNSV